MKKITGIILAGGKSSRMRTEKGDKGLMLYNGKPMIQYSIELFEALDLPIIIVANDPAYEQFGYPVVEDKLKNKGPLGGIHAGLMSSTTEFAMILACDTPNVTTELMELILNSSINNLVTIPKYKDQLHPLIGIYSKAVLPMLENNFENDQLKLINFCQEANARELEIDPSIISADVFANINTLEDL